MNEDLKQFSTSLAEDLRSKLASPKIKEFVESTKAAGEDRSFEVVMSTSDEDRQGDSLDQSKWILDYFVKNPVLLWAHNYSGFPIGVVDDITIDGDKAIATGHFAPAGLSADADLACALYEEKILRAVSPGYIQNDDGTRELLEVSFCPVPAGRYALSLRQVARLGTNTRDLVVKGFFYEKAADEKKADDSPQAGDSCELDDGTPGTLGDDPDHPGTLVCIPSKTAKSETMNDNLNQKFEEENKRHSKAIAKSIDEFKSIEEFEKSVDGEQENHLTNCMKAIDEGYELEDQKKSIDEFKSAVTNEHLTHVKAIDKAIEEFKGDLAEDGDDTHEKSIEEFTKAVGTELDRHAAAHKQLVEGEEKDDADDSEKKFYSWREKGAVAEELQEDAELTAKYTKLDKAFDIFYAFASAYLDEKTAVADFDKLLDEAVGLMKGLESKATGLLASKLKAGRAISAKNKDAIQQVIKAIEDHHTEHGKDSDEITAALKAIIASGGGGEETSDGDEPDKKALNSRSSTSGVGAKGELDAYLFGQRLMRQVNSAITEGLRQFKEQIGTRTQRGK
jgi:hypothetical protein